MRKNSFNLTKEKTAQPSEIFEPVAQHILCDTTEMNTKQEPPTPRVHGQTESQESWGPESEYSTELKNHSVKNNRNELETVLIGSIITKGEYQPAYCELMKEFFFNKEKTRIVIETLTWKNGEVREVEKEIPNPPPQFSEFARNIGVSEKRLKLWVRNFPDFAESYEMCEGVIKEFIVANGLTGKYPGQFSIFVAKNQTDMVDKTITENQNINMNEFLDKLERGEI